MWTMSRSQKRLSNTKGKEWGIITYWNKMKGNAMFHPCLMDPEPEGKGLDRGSRTAVGSMD